MNCPTCRTADFYRRHRRPHERLWWSEVYECEQCHYREGQPYYWWTLFSFKAHCPRCGNEELQIRKKRDYIDGYYRNPLSLGQKYLGAPLRYCWHCRLQFYDLRPVAKRETP